MVAVKGNRVYRIREEEMEARREDGYDIYDDDGGLVAWSKTKTVPYERYAALEAELADLRAKKSGTRGA